LLTLLDTVSYFDQHTLYSSSFISNLQISPLSRALLPLSKTATPPKINHVLHHPQNNPNHPHPPRSRHQSTHQPPQTPPQPLRPQRSLRQRHLHRRLQIIHPRKSRIRTTRNQTNCRIVCQLSFLFGKSLDFEEYQDQTGGGDACRENVGGYLEPHDDSCG